MWVADEPVPYPAPHTQHEANGTPYQSTVRGTTCDICRQFFGVILTEAVAPTVVELLRTAVLLHNSLEMTQKSKKDMRQNDLVAKSGPEGRSKVSTICLLVVPDLVPHPR